jgi:crotonobetainyl-CoA:carnitine CoA-transferase CaiB-like acyl-CoA transferase
VQADTGIMELTGYPAGPPARLGIGAVDLGTALWAAIGIQAALANRASHGEGALIEASLFEISAWWLSYHLIGYLGTGTIPQRQGTGTPFIASYEVFATAEGDLFIGAGNDRLFHSLVDELGMPELRNDPRYGSNEARVTNRADLRAAIQKALLNHPYPHPRIDDLRLIDIPVSAGKRRAAHRYPPPLLGEHTGQIQAELGIDETRICELRSKGVIA